MTASAPTPPATPALPVPPPAAPGESRWLWLTFAVGILAPLSFNIGYFVRADKKPNFIAGMDLAVAVMLVAALLQYKRLGSMLRAVPKTVWLFVAATLAALIGMVAVGTTSFGDLWAFKGLIGKVVVGNYIEYLVVAPVLVALVVDGRKARLACVVRGAVLSGLVAAIWGLVDFWNPAVLDVDVAGLYEFRNLLGGVFALLAPLCAAMVILERSKLVQVISLVVLVLGLWCQTTAGALLAIVVGVMAVSAVAWAVRAKFRRCSFKIIALPIIVIGAIVLSNLLSPRERDQSNFTDAQIQSGYRGYTLQPRSQLDAALESIAPWKYEDPADPQSNKTRLSDRARRWQAQINLIRKEPFGCGVGLYQKEIKTYYGGAYAQPAIRTDEHAAWGAEADEPVSVGMYEVVATESGLLGLVAFLALMVGALARGGAMLGRAQPEAISESAASGLTRENPQHGVVAAAQRYSFELYAGIYSFAMLTGAALFGIFHNPVASRGPAGLFAVALGLTVMLKPPAKAPN